MSLENYRDVFGFPVEDFYRRVGFDLQKETLHDISVDFVDTYDIFAEGIGLNPGVRETLDALQKAGIRQYILSALREDLLSQMVKDFNIGRYFFRFAVLIIYMRPEKSNGENGWLRSMVFVRRKPL